GVGRLNGCAVIGIANAEAVLKSAVEKQKMRFAASKKLPGLLFALPRRRHTRKKRKVVSSEGQGRVGIAPCKIETECIGHVQAKLRGDGRVFVTVVDPLPSRREQIERRYRRVVGQKMRNVDGIIETRDRSAHA